MDRSTIFSPSRGNSRIPNRDLHFTTNPTLATSPTNSDPDYNPTSKSAIESLETIKVNSSFLEKHPLSCCKVCEMEFVLDLEVKMLPCKHVFHSECILQWLERKNTCPACQFQLPTQEDEDYDLQGLPRGENFIGTIISEELLDDAEETEEELAPFRNAIGTIIVEQLLNDVDNEEALMHFQNPQGPVVVRPNLTMDGWQLDITIITQFRNQDRDFLGLTSVSVVFNEILNCLYIMHSQLLMESEIESLDPSLSLLPIVENGFVLGVVGMPNGVESSVDDWVIM